MTKEELEQYRSIVAELDEIQDLDLKRTLEEKKWKIEEFIEDIEDSLTRRIFRYRYIKGKVRPSWQWIAFKIGHYDEQYPRRKHNKYLNFENKE